MGHWKGGVGEREVIALLQPWWRQLEPEATFHRTPGSGGWAKTRKVPPGFKGHGDLITDPETCRLFPWSIEVKWRKSISDRSVSNFAEGKPSPIWGYWRQCSDDADRNVLRPMLWFRGRNVKGRRMPWRVVTRGEGVLKIRLATELFEIHPMYFSQAGGRILEPR